MFGLGVKDVQLFIEVTVFEKVHHCSVLMMLQLLLWMVCVQLEAEPVHGSAQPGPDETAHCSV